MVAKSGQLTYLICRETPLARGFVNSLHRYHNLGFPPYSLPEQPHTESKCAYPKWRCPCRIGGHILYIEISAVSPLTSPSSPQHIHWRFDRCAQPLSTSMVVFFISLLNTHPINPCFMRLPLPKQKLAGRDPIPVILQKCVVRPSSQTTHFQHNE